MATAEPTTLSIMSEQDSTSSQPVPSSSQPYSERSDRFDHYVSQTGCPVTIENPRGDHVTGDNSVPANILGLSAYGAS